MRQKNLKKFFKKQRFHKIKLMIEFAPDFFLKRENYKNLLKQNIVGFFYFQI